MNKYLIFRTDRIGDFLLSAILIRTIKRNSPNSFVRVLASKKNFEYIKSFKDVDDVVLNNKNYFSQLKILKNLKKDNYSAIIIHDNKKRSNFLSFFLNSPLKIKNNPNSKESHIYNIKDIISKLGIDFSNEDLNILENRSYTNEKDLPNDYIVFHFDEKWIHGKYINHYTNIEPTLEEFTNFLSDLSKKTEKNLVITTGLQSPEILKKAIKVLNNSKINFFENLNFLEIESIISSCNLLISCHGAVSHVCAAKNIKQVDIIDKSYNYSSWSDHFRNYNYIYRTKFSSLSKNILDII